MFSCELHPILYRINVSVKSSKLLLKRSMSSTDLKEIFQIAVESVQPQKLIRNELQLQCRHLLVRGECYQLRKPCYIVGFGKAVLGMATEIENVLGDQLERGVVAVPVGIFEKYKGCNRFGSKIEYIEGAKDNLPDKNAEGAAQRIKNLVEGLTEDDLLIVLISGGGSSLLPLPVPPITLEEKVDVIKKLAKRGADICELNTVRKKISVLKGGGLAEVAYPCKIISLVLSDIVGDPLDFIASGPTIPTAAGDSAESAVQVLKKYHIYDEIPDSIKLVLYGGKDQCPGRVPVRNGEYEHVKNYIIGNNTIAAEAARSGSINKGLQSVIVSTEIDGDVNKISKIYARIACNLAAAIRDPNKDDLEDFLKGIANNLRAKRDFIQEVLDMDFTRPICLIFAGEPTVVVTGTGRGGRNQQLALAFSLEINKLGIKSADISFLSCGTDGIDGPTDAAGAMAICDTLKEEDETSLRHYLDNNDSYGFYEKYQSGNNLIKIGHTGTNVMDIHLMTIRPKKGQN